MAASAVQSRCQGLSENPDDVGRTQIIIAKHRNGSIADIDMRFRHDEVRFVDEQESLVNQANSMPVLSSRTSLQMSTD